MKNKNLIMLRNNLSSNKRFFSEVFFENKWVIVLMELSLLLIVLSFLHFFNDLTVFLIQTAAFVLSVYGIFARMTKDLRAKKLLTENTLLCIAVLLVFIIGKTAEAVLVSAIFESFRIVRDYCERVMRQKINSLIDFKDKTITKIEDDEIVSYPAESIHAGDMISVAPGELILADGTVVHGESVLDISGLVGSDTVLCREGDKVYSGSVNLSGNLVIESDSDFSDCVLTKITDTVKKTEAKKSIRERFIFNFSKVLPIAVFGLAVFFGLIIPLFGSHEYTKWMYRALICLVVAYPFAIVTLTPAAYSAGISSASKMGLLFESTEAVDISADLTSIVFDKTGTISTGDFTVVDAEPVEGIDVDDLFKFALYAEIGGEHPIARAICAYVNTETDDSVIKNRMDIAGKGRAAILQNGLTICAGNAEMMEELGLEFIPASSAVTSVFVSGGGKYLGRIDLVDTPKSDAAYAVERLRREGVVNIALITGDNTLAATRTGKEIGITEIYADCSVEDKIERIKYLTKLQNASERLAYVCSGSSNAEILDAADLGIMINSLDTFDTSDNSSIIVLKNEPTKIVELVSCAKNISRVIDVNMVVSVGVKALLIILGLSGAMTMWIAALLDCAATQFALINAAQLLKRKDEKKIADK